MLTFDNKIRILEKFLSEIKDTYSDSFKTDIQFFFDDFHSENKKLKFLQTLNSKQQIYDWVDNLTSKIVLNFNEDEEQLSDFIFYQINKS